MNQCEKGIDCLQCNSRGMCSSYANFKYEQGYNKAIDDFVKLANEVSGWTPNCIEHNLSLTVFTLHQIAEQLKNERN